MRNLSSLDLNDLRLLLHVVDYGGFTAASKALGIPTSTLSQRIAALERLAETGLLRRTTRSLSVTEAGACLLQHARAIDGLGREAEQAMMGLKGETTGILRISSSVALAQFALAPVLAKFLRLHPKVEVRLDATNRYVVLIGEGYDLGLRAYSAPLKDSSMLIKVLARTPLRLAASPMYLESFGEVGHPRDLSRCRVLHFAPAFDRPVWTLGNGTVDVSVDLTPTMCSDDMATLQTAAIDGAGIIALPSYVMADALGDGRLVPVLPDWQPHESTVSMLSPPRRQASLVTKTFWDFIAVEMPVVLATGAITAPASRSVAAYVCAGSRENAQVGSD